MSVPSHVTHDVRDLFVSEAIASAKALVKAFESSSFTLQLLRPSSTLIAQCEIVQVLLGHQLLRQALDGFALLPTSEQRLRRTWLARTLRTFFARHAELEAVADFLEAEDDDLGMTWEERFEPSHAWILAHEATEEDLRELGLRRSDWDAFMQGRAPVATLVLAGSLAIASDPDDPLQMYTDALFEVRVGVGHLAFESCTGLERIRARLEELVSTASSISPPDDAASMARKLHDLNNRTVVPGEWRAIADRLLTQMSVPPAERAARNLPEEIYRADLPLLSGQRAAEAILYGEPHEPQHALFFEGGGPRGLVAHAGLTELQRLLGAYESANHSIYHSFDMVAGSGIGGALAALVFGLGLELPRMSQFFHELVRAVFARQAPSQAQPRPEVLAERQEAARAVAHKFVSEAADNGKAPPCSVVLVLQCAHQDQPDTLAPFIFYTGKVDDDVAGQFFKERAVRLQRPTADVMADPKQAHKLVENWTTAVLATCAAPWLMKAVTFEDVSLIDGSVSSNCPAMVVWPLLRSTLSAERPLASVTCLGTGQASGSQRPRVSFHSSKDPSLAGVLNIVRGTTSGVPPWDTFCAEVGSNVYDKLVADEPLLTRIDPQFEFEFLDKIDRTDVDTQLVIADLAKRNAAITMPTLVQRLVSSLPTPTPGNVTQLTYEEEAFLWQSAAFVHLSARPEDAQRAKQSCGRFTVSQLEGMLKALDKKLVRDEAHAQSFDLRRPDEDASVSGTPVVTVTFVYQRMQPGDAKSQALVYKERRQHLKQLEKLQPQLHHQTYRYQRLLAVGEHDSGDGDRFFVTVTAGRRENSQTLEQLVGANTLSFADRAFILVDVWRALQHLWSIKYVYRAIDLSSVLLDKLDPQDSDSDGLRRHYAVQLGDMYLAKTKQARTLLTQEEWRGEDTADLKLMLGRFGRLMVTVLRGELLTEEESAPGKPCPLIPEDVAAAVSDTRLKNAIKRLGKLAGTCWREAEKRPPMSRMGMRMTQITDDLEGLGSSRRNLHVRPGGCTCALCTGSTLGTRPVGSPRDRKYFAAEQCTLELDGKQQLLWKELATACNGHEFTMSNWKPEDVARWLSQVLGSDLAETMVETHRVNGRMLQNLKLKDLEGSLERPSALAVLDAIERLKHNHAKLRAITDAFGVYLLPGTPKSLVLPNTLPVVLPQQLVFDKRRMIGQGKFGSVYHTVLQDAHGRQRDVAVKVPKEPTECDENKLAEMRAAELVEILCLAKVGGHDNVVELLGVCENVLDAAGPCPVLAYHENGDLLSFLQRHKNGETWDQDSCRVMELLRGIVAGVAHVHEVGLVHGDLRLDNVVLTSKHVPRISDFGHARCSGGRWPQQKQQPLRRMPPEYFTGHHYDCSGDVWMLGLLLADVLRMTEVDPFDVASSCWDDLEEEARALIDSEVPAPNVGLDEAVRGAVAEPEHQELLLEVIGKCLAIDANERFQDAGEVLKALDGRKDVC